MKKCYIAGKIGGLYEEEYTRLFEQAKKEVIELGYDPVSPLDLPHEHGRTWSEYMREDMIELLKCEALYAINNSHESKGAMIEINTAISVGIKVIFQKTNYQ